MVLLLFGIHRAVGSMDNIGDGLVGSSIMTRSSDRNRRICLCKRIMHSLNSRRNIFFINTNDNGYLDKENPSTPYAHPVFGKVVEGMEVVLKIQKVPTDMNDRPLRDVVIEKAEVIED